MLLCFFPWNVPLSPEPRTVVAEAKVRNAIPQQHKPLYPFSVNDTNQYKSIHAIHAT